MRVRLVPVLTLPAALAVALSLSAACRQPKGGSTPSASTAAGAAAPGTTAAEINGVAISTEDVDSAIGPTLSKLQEQIYSTRLTQLDAMIDDRLIAEEAKKRGLSSTALLEEVTAKAPVPTDAEIAAFFELNKARLPGDLAKWQDQIRTYLNAQRAATARTALVKRLRDAAQVKVYLSPPPVFRANVVLTGAQVRGNVAAPVTIVEFSDFHCPFCRRVQPVLTQVLQQYGARVRLVYKDMPIDGLHPQARGVAEAARCAADQGHFWEFHDKVYANAADGSDGTLQRFAQESGLDLARFASCRTSRRFQAEVEKDVQEGTALGISGTPGFFINGRFLSGAQPLETFTKIIDEELSPRAGAEAAR
jgi:protein-disulfide isomerase